MRKATGTFHMCGVSFQPQCWLGSDASCSHGAGLPHQNLSHWKSSLSEALTYTPPHLSVYNLGIEPNTRFARVYQPGVYLGDALCLKGNVADSPFTNSRNHGVVHD